MALRGVLMADDRAVGAKDERALSIRQAVRTASEMQVVPYLPVCFKDKGVGAVHLPHNVDCGQKLGDDKSVTIFQLQVWNGRYATAVRLDLKNDAATRLCLTQPSKGCSGL